VGRVEAATGGAAELTRPADGPNQPSTGSGRIFGKIRAINQ
jgi:hypothetical protein